MFTGSSQIKSFSPVNEVSSSVSSFLLISSRADCRSSSILSSGLFYTDIHNLAITPPKAISSRLCAYLFFLRFLRLFWFFRHVSRKRQLCKGGTVVFSLILLQHFRARSKISHLVALKLHLNCMVFALAILFHDHVSKIIRT